MAAFNFDATEVDPSSGAGALPKGRYPFHVTEADIAPASSGKGDVLSLTYEVLSGEFQGRKVWDRMNIRHDNPVAQKIGQEQLSALCHATGRMQISDTEDLKWAEFEADIDVETYTKGNGDPGERNVVKKYVFGDVATPPEGKAPPQRQAPQSRQSSPPPRAAAGQGGRNVPWK